ncbi:unnamed protein product [Diabrotica balteata]|uniref:BED-type domain-containing protein n=1 Tax=Diabrotica balteata TaxID=107213 RepID=A0A9N9TCN7_DIABA|nr:unnamed protein product [Diabrotica balteata]
MSYRSSRGQHILNLALNVSKAENEMESSNNDQDNEYDGYDSDVDPEFRLEDEYQTNIRHNEEHYQEGDVALEIKEEMLEQILKQNMNSKKKTSIVWDFFTIIDDARAKCNMCSQVLSYKTSVTNLRQHVQRKHPSITFNESVQCKTKNQDSVPIDNDETDIQPFSIVEDEGFREFCDAVGYTLPSRKTLSKNLLPAKYLETLYKTREIMATAELVTITTDMWSSRNGDSFMGVTAHFINDKFELKSILLEVFLFDGSHTSVNLANELRRVTTKWDLHNKIFIVITDNGANVKKAILEELQLKHLACLVHTINLIAQDGLESIKSLIEKVKLVVSLFKRSNLAKEKLDWCQKQNGKDPKKLIQAVPTRWNSVYYMLERIVNLKEEARASIAVSYRHHLPKDRQKLLKLSSTAAR